MATWVHPEGVHEEQAFVILIIIVVIHGNQMGT